MKPYREIPNFQNHYSNCPLCSKQLHFSYLIAYCDSTNPKYKLIIKSLLELAGKELNDNIKVGIPCCDCIIKYELDYELIEEK